MMVHRYILFGGNGKTKHGGWDDFKGSFPEIEKADDFATRVFDWWQIVDVETFQHVGGGVR